MSGVENMRNIINDKLIGYDKNDCEIYCYNLKNDIYHGISYWKYDRNNIFSIECWKQGLKNGASIMFRYEE